MGKYVETKSRKMVGAFAGVGALVEDLKGVVEIQPIDKWIFFTKDKHLESEYHLSDNRLLQRLKDEKGFPKLKALVKVPTNTTKKSTQQKYITPTDWEFVATAKYLPKWMFCSKCKRFKPLKDWWCKWDSVIEQYDNQKERQTTEYFIPPKCGFCYEQARDKKGKWHIELTQVRFIMTSSDGEIRDVPWNKWITFKNQVQDEGDQTIDLDTWQSCCDEQDLHYEQGKSEDLAGILIHCKQCNKRKSLTGLHGLSYYSNREKTHRYKMALRSSNSVYYPILVHSLYLPSRSNISDSDQASIEEWSKDGEKADFMFKALRKKYPQEVIENHINTKNSQGFEKEINYRRKEYQFLLKHQGYRHDDFSFTHQKTNDLEQYRIDYLIKIPRLKMTTVQTGYTRQQPLDIDLFLNDEIGTIKPKYTSTQAKNTEYLLGMENFGEGIFIVFNKNIVYEYLQNKQSIVQNIFEKSRKSPLFKKHFEDVKHLARFITVHTFSHLLMKELEFTCGYPTVSLQERLFVDNEKMHGVLIYTVGGMDGSYGGLVSQANPTKFKQLLENAFKRAEDCASDPICYHSEGQGVAQMNLAACYSCALVAENACEVFNSFLDRNILAKLKP